MKTKEFISAIIDINIENDWVRLKLNRRSTALIFHYEVYFINPVKYLNAIIKHRMHKKKAYISVEMSQNMKIQLRHKID